MKPIYQVLILAIVYFATYCIGASCGLIHPACYAYAGSLMPLLFAFIYLKTSALIQKFGAATALNGFVVIIFVLAGEVDVIAAAIFIILTALAEVIRYYNKYDTLKGVRRSFIPFGLSFYAYTIHWWTDTEGSLAAAVEEMPAGYDQLMKPVIDNTPMLCVAILIGIPVAMLAIRLAERCMKKQAGLLK